MAYPLTPSSCDQRRQDRRKAKREYFVCIFSLRLHVSSNLAVLFCIKYRLHTCNVYVVVFSETMA